MSFITSSEGSRTAKFLPILIVMGIRGAIAALVNINLAVFWVSHAVLRILSRR